MFLCLSVCLSDGAKLLVFLHTGKLRAAKITGLTVICLIKLLVFTAQCINVRRTQASTCRNVCDLPQVHAEAAVFAGTFQTDPDAVRHADPLWTVSTAVKTVLQTDTHDNISTDMS